MVFSERPQGRPFDKPVGRDLLILVRQVINRQPQVIQVIELRQHIGRLLQTDLGQAGLAGRTFDVFQHAVEDGPSKVRFRVRQAGLVVGAGRFAQGKIPFPLQVSEVHRPLPVRPVLQEVLA